jgi:hypothetical protein
LVTLNSGLPSQWLERRLFKVEIQILRRFGVAKIDLAVRCSFTLRIRLSECFAGEGLLRRPGHEFPE